MTTVNGPRTDVADIVAGLDVFVSASLWEGLPTVILEAMLLGTPVVATNITGSRDLVIDGQTGLLAPARDSDALAQAATPTLLASMLDALHTLAGAARAVGLDDLEWLCSALEGVFKAAAGARFDGAQRDRLHHAVDRLRG